MKKTFKHLAICAVAGTLCLGTAALAACNKTNSTTGEAYGLVHTAGYAGYATVTVEGDKITNVTLSEVCLPTHVTADTAVAEADKVTGTVNDHNKVAQKVYYKTVKYAGVTMTYDATLDGTYSKGYMIGDKTLVEYFQTEANVKAYYNAVMANNVAVVVAGAEKKDVMTKKALSKEENGYWATANGSKVEAAEGQTYWMANRDATVKYVKENGVANLLKLVRDGETNFWMDGTVSTGATWTDFNTTKPNSISYAQLIVNAHTAATK